MIWNELVIFNFIWHFNKKRRQKFQGDIHQELYCLTIFALSSSVDVSGESQMSASSFDSDSNVMLLINLSVYLKSYISSYLYIFHNEIV